MFNLSTQTHALKLVDFWPQISPLLWPATPIDISVEFKSDGTIWHQAEVLKRLNAKSSNADTYFLYGLGDEKIDGVYRLEGGGGDDKFVGTRLQNAKFAYGPGDGHDTYDLGREQLQLESPDDFYFACGTISHCDNFRGKKIYSSILGRNNVWDLTTITSSRAAFSIDGDALTIMIDGDTKQALTIQHAFTINSTYSLTGTTAVPGSIIGKIKFSDLDLSFEEMVNRLNSDPSSGHFLLKTAREWYLEQN